MLQCALLYHIIWRSLGDHEDHMIYKQRRRHPAWYEPTSILKTRLSTIKDLPQNCFLPVIYWKIKLLKTRNIGFHKNFVADPGWWKDLATRWDRWDIPLWPF